jgi:uncharacterized protein
VKSRWSRVWHDLLGHSHERFLDLLDDQIEAIADNLERLRSNRELRSTERGGVVDGHPPFDEDWRLLLVRELSSALTTPIDREDLFRLSRSIHEVLDNLLDFIVEVRLYEPTALSAFDALLDAVDEGVGMLREATSLLGRRPEELFSAAIKARHSASEVRREYHAAMSRLLHRELDIMAFRERELLRRLDVVGLRLGEAADALTDGALKRMQ